LVFHRPVSPFRSRSTREPCRQPKNRTVLLPWAMGPKENRDGFAMHDLMEQSGLRLTLRGSTQGLTSQCYRHAMLLLVDKCVSPGGTAPVLVSTKARSKPREHNMGVLSPERKAHPSPAGPSHQPTTGHGSCHSGVSPGALLSEKFPEQTRSHRSSTLVDPPSTASSARSSKTKL